MFRPHPHAIRSCKIIYQVVDQRILYEAVSCRKVLEDPHYLPMSKDLLGTDPVDQVHRVPMGPGNQLVGMDQVGIPLAGALWDRVPVRQDITCLGETMDGIWMEYWWTGIRIYGTMYATEIRDMGQ
eukprot:3332471-Amphidinium_carterae.1